MIARIAAWHRGLTARERLLTQIAAGLVALALPLLGLQAAFTYRAEAARERASAETLRADVQALIRTDAASTGPLAPAGDGTLRGRALAAAGQLGLTPERIEPQGPTGLSIAFAPSPSISAYRWIDMMNRSGFTVARVAMVRSGEGDQVRLDAALTEPGAQP